MNGLVVRGQGLLVPLEAIKSSALAAVGKSIVGVYANSLIKSAQGLLVPLEVIKSAPFIIPLLFGFLRC